MVTIAFCALALTACGNAKPVVVDKAPMSVSTKYLEDEPEPSKVIQPDQEAVTKWSLGCKTDIKFDITQKDLIGADYLVSIKPKTVRVALDAPVTIYISKTAKPEIVEHENAHAGICRRVYEKAENVAKEAAEGVFNRNFQAHGKTAEEACARAVEAISSEICQTYHLRTVEEINRVNEILDDLESKMPKTYTHEQLVDLAFSKYTELR